VNPVEAVMVVPLMVDPWKVPPEKEAPVNPVEADTVDPWKVPPVNEGEATVAPYIVEPVKDPPVNEGEAIDVAP
jgi:hypothetical protein